MTRRIRLTITTAAALLLCAGPAQAGCPDSGVSQPFADWGDNGDYFAAPGGLFDGGLSWEAKGAASVVPNANPYAQGDQDTTSAELQPKASITSPPLCLARNHPHMRFAATATEKGHLYLEVLWTDEKGKAKAEELAWEDGNRWRSWGLSKNIQFKKVLPKDEKVRDIRLRFTAYDGKATWLVDNVFVDPVKRG